MDSLSFLGTGPGDIDAGRFQSSILLRVDQSHFLLDAGEPCAQRLMESGRNLDLLDGVFLSHCHADHVGGLPLLIQGSWLAGRTRPLPIYLPAHLVAPLRAWLDAILLHREKIKFDVQLLPWTEGQTCEVGPVTVRPSATTHLSPADGQARSFLLDMTFSGKRLVYSGDIGSAEDLATVMNSPLDVLICELAHVSPEDIIAAVKSTPIEMLCLTHLARGYSERRGEIKITLEEGLPQTRFIYLPVDGETIDF